jgi:hypothetical protein
MRLCRMTTRRWMSAVAVGGLLLGVVVWGHRLKQRRDYCLQQARIYAQMENSLRRIDPGLVSVSCSRLPPIVVDGHTYQADTVAAYNAGLKKIYLHAASRPWLSVPADPPRFAIYIRSPVPQVMFFENPKTSPPKSRNTPRF